LGGGGGGGGKEIVTFSVLFGRGGGKYSYIVGRGSIRERKVMLRARRGIIAVVL